MYIIILYTGVSENSGKKTPPKSSIWKIGFSINFHHPFWGPTLIFGNTQLVLFSFHCHMEIHGIHCHRFSKDNLLTLEEAISQFYLYSWTSVNGKLLVCGPVVWIPRSSCERDCYSGAPVESQTTGPQTTNFLWVDDSILQICVLVSNTFYFHHYLGKRSNLTI